MTSDGRVTPEMVTVEQDDWFVATVDAAALGVALGGGDVLRIEAERAEQISDETSAAHLMNRCLAALPRAMPVVLDAILADMQEMRGEEWAPQVYGEHLDEALPAIGLVEELLPLLSEPTLFCHADPAGTDAIGLGIGFDAPWDADMGTAAVVRVDAPGRSSEAVELFEVGGPMGAFSPFE